MVHGYVRSSLPAISRSTCSLLVIFSCCLCFGSAFSQEFALSIPRAATIFKKANRYARLPTAVKSTNGEESSGNPAFELTSALAKLDRQWKIEQAAKPSSRWTKIVFDDEATSTEEQPFDASAIPEPGAAAAAAAAAYAATQDFAYLLEPPNNSVPSCVIVFIGGAGLGQFPQIAYKEFLTRLSDRLNAAVITAPYSVGLDHFSLAKKTGELSRRAVEHCQEDSARMYPVNLPVYCVTHSLGGKLATIYMAATQQEYAGVGLMSFNNFGFSKTIGMAREFAEQIRKNTTGGKKDKSDAFAQGGSSGSEILNSVFNFAETIVGTMGFDFSPSPDAMNRLIGMKYDEDRQAKTRLFVFDEDTLDSSEDFTSNCQGLGPEVSQLQGTHLTPVYFKFGLDELELPEEARGMASSAMGGVTSASFGNEEELNGIVTEVCDWILGKKPSRRSEQPKLSGTVSDKQ
jgi:hypothetical protein